MEDDWHGSYSGTPSDGSAWIDSPRASYRVRRGGAWHDLPRSGRAAYRYWDDPSARMDYVGFRVARSLPASF